jgi:NodT family efflux transporter outer membrane factor (OMF) lipoprotein
MKTIRHCFVLAGALAAGCTHFPETQTIAPVPTPSSYTAPDEATGPQTNPGVPAETVTGSWWSLFHSQEIDQLVDQAIAGSHTLESAKARLAAEQETLRAARSALYPQASLSAAASRQKQSAASFGLPANSLPLPPNYNLYQLGAIVSYDVDVFAGTRYRIAQQAELAELQGRELTAAWLTLSGNTVVEAIQLAAANAQLEAVHDIVRIDQQNLDLVRQANRVGTVPGSDVVSAESQLAADQTLQPGIDQQLSVARHALAVLLGKAPADWSPPHLELAALQLPPQISLSLPSELAHRRPDILAAEARLRAASAQLGIATAQLFPQITLSGQITAESLSIRDLFDPAGLVWSIAAGLTQPVFDAGMRRAERRAALQELRAAAADYQQTVLQSFGQVADILQGLAHDASLVDAQKRALDSASRSVELQRQNYEKGGAGILNLLDAQRQYQQALLGYVKAQSQRYLDTAQLQVALGGGPPPGQFIPATSGGP